MRFGSNVVVAVLASFVLLACKGSQVDAKAPEANPWADYKGTYAPGGPQEEPAAETKPKSGDTPATSGSSDDKPAKTADARPRKKGGKPAKGTAADSSATTTTTAAAPEPKGTPDDARTMYGSDGSTPASDDTAAPAKKTPKKRGAGKKGGKKAPAKK